MLPGSPRFKHSSPKTRTIPQLIHFTAPPCITHLYTHIYIYILERFLSSCHWNSQFHALDIHYIHILVIGNIDQSGMNQTRSAQIIPFVCVCMQQQYRYWYVYVYIHIFFIAYCDNILRCPGPQISSPWDPNYKGQAFELPTVARIHSIHSEGMTSRTNGHRRICGVSNGTSIKKSLCLFGVCNDVSRCQSLPIWAWMLGSPTRLAPFVCPTMCVRREFVWRNCVCPCLG